MEWRSVTLRHVDLEAAVAFYRDVLGMHLFGQGSDEVGLEFPERAVGQAALRLVRATAKSDLPPSSPDGVFWKLGVTVDDVVAAADRVRSRGTEVSAPRQFEDIGFVCHLRDPAGFGIELLQTTFAGGDLPPLRHELPLGSRATLAHVTLRVEDAESSLRAFTRLGLRPVSVQPVPAHRFTLYFLAAREERRPRHDLEAVENREWLWQRPYTCLELLHRWDRDRSYRSPGPGAEGFASMTFESDGREIEVSAEGELADESARSDW